MLNYKEIRARLRHGDIKRISKSLDIEQRVVSEVLNKGWHPRVKNAVLDEAMKILEEEYHGESDLIGRAEEIELSGSSFSVPDNYRKKKKSSPSNDGGPNIILYVGIFIALLFFLVPAFKTFVLNAWSKVSGRTE